MSKELEKAATKYAKDYDGMQWEKDRVEIAFIAGAKSQAAKDQLMQDLLDDIEMNIDDWCITPLVMATKFRDKQFKQESK
tara:strand:- start:2429 stop:2668 length:240 start_codon:yes stop_codon:yes gene_type:complete